MEYDTTVEIGEMKVNVECDIESADPSVGYNGGLTMKKIFFVKSVYRDGSVFPSFLEVEDFEEVLSESFLQKVNDLVWEKYEKMLEDDRITARMEKELERMEGRYGEVI